MPILKGNTYGVQLSTTSTKFKFGNGRVMGKTAYSKGAANITRSGTNNYTKLGTGTESGYNKAYLKN